MKKRFTPSIGLPELRIVMTGVNPSLDVTTLTEMTRLIKRHKNKLLTISSDGATFCAGLDLREVLAEPSARKSLAALFRFYEALIAHPRPTICLVNAPAIGGGVGLALCTDVIVMSCKGSFSLPDPLPYRPLAEVLLPVASVRRGITPAQFNKWYGKATSAYELHAQGHADGVVHSTKIEILRAHALELLRNGGFYKTSRTRKKLPQKELRPLVTAAIAASKKASFSVAARLSLGELEPEGVFVVHGRDHKARDAVVKLVKSLGMKWRHLRSVEREYGTAESLWETVYIGVRLSKAVIVLFTADDTAQLNPVHGHEAPREQSRPNVFLEAGLALGMCKGRTILLEVPPAERPSDLAGHFWISARDPDDWRKLVEKELSSFGCRRGRRKRSKRPTRASILGKRT